MRTGGALVLILCFTAMYRYGMAANECGCGVRHPQVRFCNSTFVMMVQIHDKVEANLPFTKEKLVYDYMRFNITVLQVFKPKELGPILTNEDFTSLWTEADFCGVPELTPIDTYVISGSFHDIMDESTGEAITLLMMDRCGIYLKNEDVTPYQMKGFTERYEEECGGCKPQSIYGELTYKGYGGLESQLMPEAMTKYWTLDMQCFYNPVASLHNLVRDCEGEESICRRDPDTSRCAWEMNNKFMECFKERGRSVSYRKHPNGAAVRKPSDCKFLQSKKLKRKCLRNLRKKMTERRKQNRRNSRE